MRLTPWHITFGTYADRLHGDLRPTVDREHNVPGTPFLPTNRARLNRELATQLLPAVTLTPEQREFIEHTIPTLCDRGNWKLYTCAAAPNHVHTILAAPSHIHGKQIRPLLKRWLTQALAPHWPHPIKPDGSSWWAEGGSNLALNDPEHLERAIAYVDLQRTLPPLRTGVPRTS